MGFVSNYQTENNFNFNKGARGKKNIFSLVATVVVVFAFVIGAILGIVNLSAKNSGADTVGESFPSIEASGVSDGSLKNFAVVDSNSLVIWTTANPGPDGDTVKVSGNATGTETYYSNSNLTSYIKDMRTPVKYNGNNEKYYLTSQVRNLTITYQMGSGTQDGKPCIFVMKFTLDVCAMDEEQTKTSFTYKINSMTVEYLALYLNGTGASATPYANYCSSGYTPTDVEGKEGDKKGDQGYLYYTTTIEDQDELENGDVIYSVDVDDAAIGAGTYWGEIKNGEATEVKNFAVNRNHLGGYFEFEWNNRSNDNYDLCITFDNANVVGDSELTSASGSGNDVAVGPNVYAYSLKSNIWIRADFETVTHTDKFHGHVIDTNDDLTPNSTASGAGTDTISSSAINGLINGTYNLDAAGNVTVDYYEKGDVTKDPVGALSSENTDIFKNVSSSYNGTAVPQGELGSTDVMKLTVTPNKGYYISDIIVNYNGQDHYVVYDGKIEANGAGVKYSAKGFSAIIGATNINLNFMCYNDESNIVNATNGECTLYLSGFMKDVSVHVVYKSEVFLWVEIDKVLNALGTTWDDKDENGTPLIPNNINLAGFEYKSKIWFMDSDNYIAALENFVDAIYVDGVSAIGGIVTEKHISYAEIYKSAIATFYIVVRLPGASSIDVKLKNEANGTLKFEDALDKNNNSLSSKGNVKYEKTVTDGKLDQNGDTTDTGISDGIVNVSPNYDQFVYNPLYVGNGLDYTTFKVSTVNDRKISYNAYVGTGDETTDTIEYEDKNYRLDVGENSNDSPYLYNTEEDRNGVWSNVFVNYYYYMNNSTHTGFSAHGQSGKLENHQMYGNYLEVFMYEVDGYYNRRVQLIATDSGNNPLNATNGDVIEINVNEAAIKSVTDVPNTWTEKSVYYSGSLPYVLRYKAYLDTDIDAVRVIFNLNDLYANNFQLNTYYDANEYNVDYHNNGVTDTVVKSVPAWHNVKHMVVISEVFDNVADDRTGYTLLGYVQNTKPVYNADGNDLIYYTSKSDVYFPLTLEYYDSNGLKHEYLTSYNENTYREGFSWSGTEDYDWLFGNDSYDGYTFYSYSESNYKIHKNLDQTFLYASDDEIFSYKNHDDDNTTSYTCNMYAVWSANTYQVHYNVNKENALNEGCGSSDISIVDTGLDIDFIQDNCLYYNGSFGSEYMYTTSMNFDHKFKTNTSNETSNTFKFPTLSRTGYIFVGWSVKDFDLKYNDDDLDYTKAFNSAGEYEEDWTKYLVTPDDVYNLQLREWNKVSDGSNAYTDPSSDRYKGSVSKYTYTGGPNITLYAIWKPIIYLISTDCMRSIFSDIWGDGEGDNFKSAMDLYIQYYHDYNTVSAPYSVYLDLNDKHQGNGSSEAKIYGNNQYKVQFDGKLTNLYNTFGYRTIYPTRVGYDFTGWRASVTGEGAGATYGDVIDENTILNYMVITSLASRENPSHAGYWDGVETGSYFDTTDPNALKTGGHESAWINLIPTWEAQDFTVYYSLANHTLRGYTDNHVDEAKGIVDDITFKLDDIDFNFEGMYEDTAHDNKLTYYTKTFKFDTVIPIPYFASTDYALAGWYTYYDGSLEPHEETAFDMPDEKGKYKIDNQMFDINFYSYYTYWADYKSTGEPANRGEYYSITQMIDIKYGTDGNGSLFYNRIEGEGGAISWEFDQYRSSDLVKQNKKVVQATDDDFSLENRKFTLFSHLTPKGNFIQTSAKKTNPDDVLNSTDEQMEDYYLETPNFTGNGNFSVKEYEYNTENEFVYKHTLPLTAETLPNQQTRALEDDYILEILPTTPGLYLSKLQILFGDTHIWVYFDWNSALKELRIGQVNYTIDGVNYGINSEINNTKNSEKDKATYSYQTGQAMSEWDNLIVSIGKASMYTYDANGVINNSTDNNYRNEFTASDGTVHNDCIPVYISIDFLKNAANDNIVIESTWAWQTYDVGVFMLNAEADDDGKNYQSGSQFPEEEKDYYEMTYSLNTFGEYDSLNPMKFLTGFITVPYGYQLISSPEYNYYYKLPLYKYVEGSPEENKVVVNGKTYSTIGDTIALNEDGTVVYQTFSYFYMTQTLSTYYVLEMDSDGDVVYDGMHPKKATNPLWSQDYTAGYRFLDYYELFNGYSENEFLYQSGTDMNQVFFPSKGYKFLGAYYDIDGAKPNRDGSDEKSLVTSKYYEFEYGKKTETDALTRIFNTRSIGSYNEIESYFVESADSLYIQSLLDRAEGYRWQTIYENTNFYKLYVKEKEQEVVFHIYNKETKRYEAVNTGETYRFGYTLMDNNGNYVDEHGNIVDYKNRVYIQNSTSDYIDVEEGIVKIVPSPNSGSWPIGTGFNGFVVGPNLKTLYGYDPIDGQYLYNTDYVGKFFTTSFVDLINYHGDKYNDSNMFDAYGWEVFDDEYSVDHLIHVYAIYDYQEFNIDTDFNSNSAYSGDYIYYNSSSGVHQIGTNGDVVIEIRSDIGSYKLDVNINLTWVKTGSDGTPSYIFKKNTADKLKYVVLDESMYVQYLKLIESGETRETALKNSIPNPLTYDGDTRYIFFYLENDIGSDSYYLVADNMIMIVDCDGAVNDANISIQSSYLGISFKTANYASGTTTYTIDLGAYNGYNAIKFGDTNVEELWLDAKQFEAFCKLYTGGKYLLDALSDAAAITQEGTPEYLFLRVNRGNYIMASTNFVRIKDNKAFIFDATDFFDISSWNNGSSVGFEKGIDVVYYKDDETDGSQTIGINFNLAYLYYDNDEEVYKTLTNDNIAFVRLNEVGFAYYQDQINKGLTKEQALYTAALFNKTADERGKVYIIPCLVNPNIELVDTELDTDNVNAIDVFVVCNTIIKYTKENVFEIDSNGFRVVASRIFDDYDDNNPNYTYNASSDTDSFEALGNMFMNYHLNCEPGVLDSDLQGFVILSQSEYDAYIENINTGKMTIEQALFNVLPESTDRDKLNHITTQTSGKKYIFVYRQVTLGSANVIVSSSIIEYNVDRGLTSIKTANNHFDLSAMFAKRANYYVTNESYDYAFNILWSADEHEYKIDKDIIASGGHRVGGYDIYFTLSLGYGYNGGAYTPSDIKYLALNEKQYALYSALMNSLAYHEISTTLRGIMLQEVYNALIARVEYTGLTPEARTTITVNEYNLYREAIAGTLYENLDSELKTLVNETIYTKMLDGVLYNELSDTEKLRISKSQYNLFLALRSEAAFDTLDESIKGILSESDYEAMKSSYIGQPKYNVINYVISYTALQGIETTNVYVFAYLDHTGTTLSENTVFASHIINLNTELGYAILI